MNNETELLPCPCCNSAAEKDMSRGFINYKHQHARACAVYCSKCSLEVSLCWDDHKGTRPEELLSMAIDLWNTRTHSQKIVELYKELDALRRYQFQMEGRCHAGTATELQILSHQNATLHEAHSKMENAVQSANYERDSLQREVEIQKGIYEATRDAKDAFEREAESLAKRNKVMEDALISAVHLYNRNGWNSAELQMALSQPNTTGLPDETKLLPCPFCGNEPELSSGVGYSFIGCRNTTCPGFHATNSTTDWNKRADARTHSQKIVELEADLRVTRGQRDSFQEQWNKTLATAKEKIASLEKQLEGMVNGHAQDQEHIARLEKQLKITVQELDDWCVKHADLRRERESLQREVERLKQTIENGTTWHQLGKLAKRNKLMGEALEDTATHLDVINDALLQMINNSPNEQEKLYWKHEHSAYKSYSTNIRSVLTNRPATNLVVLTREEVLALPCGCKGPAKHYNMDTGEYEPHKDFKKCTRCQLLEGIPQP